MGARVEVLPWERQPREGEEAYAAFLAYRDLGPWRTHEATRMHLGKRPGYLKPIERWSALRDWRGRACAWDDHLQAERDEVAAEEAAKWERRRLQALEEGWQLCRALRARLEQMLAIAPGDAGRRPARAGPGDAGGHPRRRRDARGGQGDGRTRADAVERPDGGAAGEAGRRAGVGDPDRGPAAPREIDPLTATDEEIKAYLALHPRFGRPPPR